MAWAWRIAHISLTEGTSTNNNTRAFLTCVLLSPTAAGAIESLVKSLKTDLAAHPSPKDLVSRKHQSCVLKRSPFVSRFNQSQSVCIKSMEVKVKRLKRTRSVDTRVTSVSVADTLR
jgi:hypothetical protein